MGALAYYSLEMNSRLVSVHILHFTFVSSAHVSRTQLYVSLVKTKLCRGENRRQIHSFLKRNLLPLKCLPRQALDALNPVLSALL